MSVLLPIIVNYIFFVCLLCLSVCLFVCSFVLFFWYINRRMFCMVSFCFPDFIFSIQMYMFWYYGLNSNFVTREIIRGPFKPIDTQIFFLYRTNCSKICPFLEHVHNLISTQNWKCVDRRKNLYTGNRMCMYITNNSKFQLQLAHKLDVDQSCTFHRSRPNVSLEVRTHHRHKLLLCPV